MSKISRCVQGLKAPLVGFKYLNEHPALWQYAGWPIVLNLIITVLIFTAVFYAASFYQSLTNPLFGAGMWWGVLEFVADAAALIVGIVLTIALVIVLWMLFSAIFCSYFYALLARKVELQLGLDKSQLKEISVLYQITDALRSLGTVLFYNVIFLLLHLIPGLGSLLYIGVTLYFDSLIYGYDYFDYALELRGIRRKEKLAFVQKHRAETVGLGLTVLCMSFIPVLGAVGMTTAVVGAVLLNRKLVD